MAKIDPTIPVVHTALEWREVSRNLELAVDRPKGELLLRIKCDPDALAASPMCKGTPEKPAKNRMLASSGGVLNLGWGLKLGLNVMVAPEVKSVF